MSKELRFTKKGELDTRGKRQLKPCPFKPCKGKGQIVKEFVPGEFYIYCLNCRRHTAIYKTEQAAINAWTGGRNEDNQSNTVEPISSDLS